MSDPSGIARDDGAITTRLLQSVGLRLFAKYGFERTTVDDIARAAGISRRTFFRYFASKNDIPWGDAGPVLEAMDRWFAADAEGLPLLDAIKTAMIRFNTIHNDGPEAHRAKMSLIHKTPVLQAHRALRSADVQAMVARFASRRLNESSDALGPRLIGQIAVGATVAAYDTWLDDRDSELEDLISEAFSLIDLSPHPLGRRPLLHQPPRQAADS